MSEITQTIKHQSIKNSAKPVLIFLFVLWVIKIFETQFNVSLHFLGVYPLDFDGIQGIITGPLIHGSFEHLASNSLSLLILVTALFFGYPNSVLKTISIVWLGSGIGTWLLARDAWHFGASGLTHGLFFFLLVASILRKDKRSVALMMIAFFMYGGMLMSIFPREVNVSFEYHLFGAIAGVIAAILFKDSDPKLQEKVYEWEGEEKGEHRENWQDAHGYSPNKPEDADLIGDEWMLDQAQTDQRQANKTIDSYQPTESLHQLPADHESAFSDFRSSNNKD